MTELFIKNWVVIFICLFVYFLPTLISLFNSKSKSFGIFLINLILGWTIIMWISLFIEAFQDPSLARYDEIDIDKGSNDETKKSYEIKQSNNLVNEFSKFTPTKAFEIWFRNLK